MDTLNSITASSQKYSSFAPIYGQVLQTGRVKYIKQELLTSVQSDSNSYPQGWFSESPLLAKMPDDIKKDFEKYNPQITYNLWHSFFTGIYGIKMRNPDIWYIGGKLTKETIGKIEIRER